MAGLVIGGGHGEGLRPAIGVGCCRPALFAESEATVDAVAIRIVGDKKQLLLGTGGGAEGGIQDSEADQDGAHEIAGKRRGVCADAENAIQTVNQ